MGTNTKVNRIADLTMAILAVNHWRLDQSADIYEGLEREGLFSTERILAMSHGQLHQALRAAGYKKAPYVVDLVCDRLFDMARKLGGENSAVFEQLCVGGNKESVEKFVVQIKGVGPKVFENFWLLVSSGHS
jgi:hypothetical protein